MDNKVKELENCIKELELRISQLEEYYKCNNCKKITLLYNCENCNYKICNDCSNRKYTNDTCIYFCKECKN